MTDLISKNLKECSNCKRPVSSLFNQQSPIIILSRQEYKKKLSGGDGMYCPNCDKILCLDCIPSIKNGLKSNMWNRIFGRSSSQPDIKLEEIPDRIMANEVRKKIQNLLKDEKNIVKLLKCQKCGSFFGEMDNETKRIVNNFEKKISANDNSITLTEMLKVLRLFKSHSDRLEKHNLLVAYRVEIAKSIDTILDKLVLPEFKKEIVKHVEEKNFDEAERLANDLKELSNFSKNKKRFENIITESLDLINCYIGVSKSLNSDNKIITLKEKPKTFNVKINS